LIPVHGPEIFPLPFIQLHLPPNVDARERMEKPKNVQEPQYNTNDHDCIQDRFQRSLHGDETVHQPEQHTHHDQDDQYLK
jgi:hypothetical protein